jgi:hypothetical protein
MDGWANSLYDVLCNTAKEPHRSTFLSGTPFPDLLSQTSLLTACSLIWFHRADDEAAQGNFGVAGDSLQEGYNAQILDRGTYMWDEGFKYGQEDLASSATTTARTVLAKTAATARHAENRALKLEVFQWCDDNMANAPSMDAAAGQVAGVIVPLSWRTVRDWMGEWKKLRSAGTP